MTPPAFPRRLLLAAALATGLPALAQPPGNGGAAPAAEAPAPTLSDLGRSLRSYFTEEELDLLFQYMRDSVVAAFKGEEVALPPDLAFKLEILLVRMKKEGGHYMDNLIKQLEKDLERNLKEKLKEKLAPPDTSASVYQLPAPVYVAPVQPPPSYPPASYPPPGYPPPAYSLPPFPFFFMPFMQPPPQTDP